MKDQPPPAAHSRPQPPKPRPRAAALEAARVARSGGATRRTNRSSPRPSRGSSAMATIHLPYLRWRARMAPGASEKLAMQSAESPGLRRGLLFQRHAPSNGCVPHNKKPRTEVRGHRVVGRSRICVARWAVVMRGVPRLPPGAFMGLGNIREGLLMSREPALLGHRSAADWSSQAGCRSAVSIE